MSRPVPTPPECLVVAPAPTRVLRGAVRSPHMRLRHGKTTKRARRVQYNAILAKSNIVGELVEPATRAIWLGERDVLTASLGKPPTTLEQQLMDTARKNGLPFYGFTSMDNSTPPGADVYDEVRACGPSTTRYPHTLE